MTPLSNFLWIKGIPMAKKPTQSKIKPVKKVTSITPEVLPPDEPNLPQQFAMDGTSHVEISVMQNIYYSKEIIEETRAAFSINRLKNKIADDKTDFLEEGELQIKKLWHGIEALTVHNTMFVVLFLFSIGEILNEVRNQLSLTDFVKWRRRVFHPKQERYIQQAQQLANMGDFAKKYASMGKKRLLILDKLKKDEDKDSYEALFSDQPIPEEVEDSLLDDEQIRQNPFPDSTEDLEGDLLKEHVDAVITFRRLKNAGINFVTFDQAYLIAAFKKNPIPIKNAKKIIEWLQEKGTIRTQKKWFDILIMNKMVFPERQSRSSTSRDSLNYLLANFVKYCKECDFTDQEWLEKQKETIEDDFVRQSNYYLKKVARVFSIRLSTRKNN
jgi:hypothetical protein